MDSAGRAGADTNATPTRAGSRPGLLRLTRHHGDAQSVARPCTGLLPGPKTEKIRFPVKAGEPGSKREIDPFGHRIATAPRNKKRSMAGCSVNEAGQHIKEGRHHRRERQGLATIGAYLPLLPASSRVKAGSDNRASRGHQGRFWRSFPLSRLSAIAVGAMSLREMEDLLTANLLTLKTLHQEGVGRNPGKREARFDRNFSSSST